MGKKKKKSIEPLKIKDKNPSILVKFSLKKLLGRIPMFRPGNFHTPKKGKGVAYNRKKDNRSWKKDR